MKFPSIWNLLTNMYLRYGRNTKIYFTIYTKIDYFMEMCYTYLWGKLYLLWFQNFEKYNASGLTYFRQVILIYFLIPNDFRITVCFFKYKDDYFLNDWIK